MVDTPTSTTGRQTVLDDLPKVTGQHWYVIEGINPEPWTSPTVSMGRINGKIVPRVFKSAALTAYQESLAEAMVTTYPDLQAVSGPVCLEFFFWRQLVRYEGQRRRTTKNRVDATNLQKACEDAMQGVLIENDREVVHVSSWVIEQTAETEPLIVISLTPQPPPPPWATAADQLRRPKDDPAPLTTDFNVEELF